MLIVTIASGEGSYSAIFNTDDYDVAADMMLQCLINEHGFFGDNKIARCNKEDTPSHFGILLMPGEEGEFEWKSDDYDSTWHIYITEYKFGDVIAG